MIFPLYLHKTMNMPLDYGISFIGCMDDKHALYPYDVPIYFHWKLKQLYITISQLYPH
jgi:hypothetical protein